MRALVGVDGLAVVNHEWWDDATFAPLGHPRRRGRGPLVGRPPRRGRAHPGQPPRRRQRRDGDRRAGPAPRGHRLLRRRQVPVPRAVGPGAHRRHPLARRAHHQRRDHRHPGDHPGPGAGRRRRRPGARRAPRPLRRRRPRHRWAPPRRLRRPPRRRGRRPPTSPPRPTSSTSTRPVRRVVSLVAPRYADLWTGAKGFYKVEPVVADGGEVILYAPHITQIAADPPRARHHRLPLPGLVPRPLGRGARTCPGASWPTRPTSSAPAPTTPSRASASGSGSPSPRASPRTSCARPTSATSTRPSVDLDALRGRPRHARGPRRRRGPLPPALSGRGRAHARGGSKCERKRRKSAARTHSSG